MRSDWKGERVDVQRNKRGPKLVLYVGDNCCHTARHFY